MKNKCECLCHCLPSSTNNPNQCTCCLTCPHCNEQLVINHKVNKNYNPKCKYNGDRIWTHEQRIKRFKGVR